MDIHRYLQEKKEKVDSALERYLPKKEECTLNLHKAIQHSLFAGGKRIRPILSDLIFAGEEGEGGFRSREISPEERGVHIKSSQGDTTQSFCRGKTDSSHSIRSDICRRRRRRWIPLSRDISRRKRSAH